MTAKNGTASQATDTYIDFQEAVVRALPRDIDPDVMLMWTKSDDLLSRILRGALAPKDSDTAEGASY